MFHMERLSASYIETIQVIGNRVHGTVFILYAVC
jgi:hypothetical protein